MRQDRARTLARAGAVGAALIFVTFAARGLIAPLQAGSAGSHHAGPSATASGTGSGPAARTDGATGSGSPAAASAGVGNDVPAPGATVPAQAPSVLPGLSGTAPIPTPAGLQHVLGPLLAARGLGSAVSAVVVDVATGRELLADAPDRPLVPASTAKLLTSAAVLSLLGPDATLGTTVVQGTAADQIVLVGGGDVLLGAGHGSPTAVIGRAGLADLADRTAVALRASGRTSVRLGLDDTLFRGPAVSPAWQPSDLSDGFVAPVMPLEVDVGHVPGHTPRQADPALAAAQTFAALLARDGIKVSGPPVRAAAPAAATVLAQVQSAPIGDQVEYALTDSDNTVAEALARIVALKSGRPATFTDAGAAVLARVGQLGVPVAGDVLSGGSGLGAGSAITTHSLTSLLVLAASAGHPELRPVLTGLPVAGASGTLAERFGGNQQTLARGVVRAKTGTLTGVSSLAGTVVDADGRLLAFAVLANRTGSTTAARTALDNVAAALTSCGCRT